MDPIDRRQSAVLSCSWAVRPPDWPCGGLPAGLLGCAQRAGGSRSLRCAVWCITLVPLPFYPACCFGISLFAPSFVSPSFPRSYEIFLPPSVCFVSPKSQRDSRWGVVGYDLRAGCDVRRGSQRCVGRGARGAVPGMDWAWSWACRASTGEWMRMGSARRADARTGGQRRGRADRSLGCSGGRKV